LNKGLNLIGDLPILATLSDNEKALKASLEAVYDAPHQLCQEHFVGNLSKPIHEDDGKLRQGLKEHLSPLPSVPEIEAGEAIERMEHLVGQEDPLGKKGA
jgi:hypothetical protein